MDIEISISNRSWNIHSIKELWGFENENCINSMTDHEIANLFLNQSKCEYESHCEDLSEMPNFKLVS